VSVAAATRSAESARVIANRIANRFPRSPALRGYIRGKIRIDPAYEAIAQLLLAAPTPVLDLGCGLGLLSFYLRERGFTAPIHGIDTAADKITLATKAASTSDGLTFAVADAGQPPPVAPTTLALDILHYFDPPRQAALLRQIANALPPGGRVIIRNAPRDERSWRYWLTFLEEIWVRGSRWIIAKDPINFPSIAEIVAPFEAAGCEATVEPLWGNTPFNSHLFVFTKSSAPPSDGCRPTEADLLS
jgi:2-polyprenyl-3-methyl-5-hydroxy-6-metoxy-1,4-benzoquinol methylase